MFNFFKSKLKPSSRQDYREFTPLEARLNRLIPDLRRGMSHEEVYSLIADRIEELNRQLESLDQQVQPQSF